MLITLFLSLFSGVSIAKKANLNTVTITTLAVSPKVCVVSELQDFCDLDLQFDWQLSTPNDICLYQENQLINCWKQQSLGQFNYKARVQVETIYSLINPHTGELLAKTYIEVQSTRAKKSKHGLRSPWSFF